MSREEEIPRDKGATVRRRAGRRASAHREPALGGNRRSRRSWVRGAVARFPAPFGVDGVEHGPEQIAFELEGAHGGFLHVARGAISVSESEGLAGIARGLN